MSDFILSLSLGGEASWVASVFFSCGDVSTWVEFESLLDDGLSGLIEIGIRMLNGQISYNYTSTLWETSAQDVIDIEASMKPDGNIQFVTNTA